MTDAATPRVSMIMPVYNGERYLASALQSVLDQSFTDFELMCLDDGSRDSTPAILADFAGRDTRIRHSVNPQNIGLPATLNRGFAMARGALHSWTSDDNLLAPTMLARLVDALDGAPEAGIAYAGLSIIDAEGKVTFRRGAARIEERFFGNPVGAAFLYRRKVTEALGGYDESLFGAEDYDFWLRAARQFTFVAVDDADLYRYRRHDGSLTDQRERDIKDKVTQVLLRELGYVEDRGLRARALLKLFTDDYRRARAGLIGKAWAADPATVLAHMPQLARHYARLLLRGGR